MTVQRLALLMTAAALLGGCGENAKLPFQAGVGPKPQLPEPTQSLIPTVKVSKAVGWQGTHAPVAPPGFKVQALADRLEHPRWLYKLPNGDVLVAESNTPPKPEGTTDGGSGLMAWAKRTAAGIVMSRAGADAQSANRITLLRDADGDGKAEVRTVFISGLSSPFGMALVGNELYIANADAVVKVPYQDGQTEITATPVKVTDLPAGINHHWTKNIVANGDGSKLYVTVGSNSNVGENGLEAEEGRAAIWEVDPRTGQKRLFASGLRNPNGLAWKPGTSELWTVVNERDEIGSDLVPDYLTSVKDGAFYGWPWSYYGSHVDARVQPPRPDKVSQAIAPDYALGTHVAPLGLTFSDAQGMPQNFSNGVFVGEHGSWNRNPQSGYKVVFIGFQDGKPTGMPIDFLTGFLNNEGEAQGRPVGVILDQQGALLVADDVGNTVWRVSQAR
ncbi:MULTISPECIES: sorbosone dehydrogenase family protein [unclassified Pseudomonas]|uniref:PQQ-dependent sugar dehydrogenase n=1 Tax=unclassified Pseudomonas TaxID=196821 RepID=UPI000D361412|nr:MULTISPECIES: sorbosone dehydrogenase family protein [unclassified Pseudomonas]RAU44690.1 sorbosone dehydrogenase family protein [Pseudomonas sp. RIT 409]RAU55143.1 sorbosone dehydrogenase family protein [Pseudomonas sp. RIT 412]